MDDEFARYLASYLVERSSDIISYNKYDGNPPELDYEELYRLIQQYRTSLL